MSTEYHSLKELAAPEAGQGGLQGRACNSSKSEWNTSLKKAIFILLSLYSLLQLLTLLIPFFPCKNLLLVIFFHFPFLFFLRPSLPSYISLNSFLKALNSSLSPLNFAITLRISKMRNCKKRCSLGQGQAGQPSDLQAGQAGQPSDLQTELHQKDLEIARLQTELATKQTELDYKQKELNTKETELVAKAGQIANMSIRKITWICFINLNNNNSDAKIFPLVIFSSIYSHSYICVNGNIFCLDSINSPKYAIRNSLPHNYINEIIQK